MSLYPPYLDTHTHWIKCKKIPNSILPRQSITGFKDTGVTQVWYGMVYCNDGVCNTLLVSLPCCITFLLQSAFAQCLPWQGKTYIVHTATARAEQVFTNINKIYFEYFNTKGQT